MRQNPNSPEPFVTLGRIHEEMNNPNAAMDAYMIAAHITPSDVTQWKYLVEMARLCFETSIVNNNRKLKNKNLISYCLSKAIAAAPKNDTSLLWERATFFRANSTNLQ